MYNTIIIIIIILTVNIVSRCSIPDKVAQTVVVHFGSSGGCQLSTITLIWRVAKVKVRALLKRLQLLNIK